MLCLLFAYATESTDLLRRQADDVRVLELKSGLFNTVLDAV